MLNLYEDLRSHSYTEAAVAFSHRPVETSTSLENTAWC